MVRPEVHIPDSPESPYPIYIERTEVIPGFGRGSTDLGFPTANINVANNKLLTDINPGVYFGYAKLYKSDKLKNGIKDVEVERVDRKSSVVLNYGRHLQDEELEILPMVMSLGWNPYYGNKEKTCEIYIIHKFSDSFYGADMSAVICGYLRPELNYEGIDALKKDIQLDVDIGLQNLKKEGYLKCKYLLN
ncbi:uncharacterized protein C5L36_0B00530 [Pichia kudriavzevii]|uniref:Riboflavin kinase n=1 Tax=Pichia kudriavzevii TaxID=4909 RepID=A0A099NXH4_PICKU|nr:uncharacterized protein C5L36_0B00530 [Pichia kudriavzevii]AWU74786.1 hypothetical protein C5L36_0B00530 [Pichia kudriavzevii]KGK37518.1 hypothetical protein JL09_g3338 [Pichia kudriavzevii]ONH71463.1 Riboflavin kinase [Pichia kudriavzevii]